VVEILQFIFSGFWTFLGFWILFATACSAIGMGIGTVLGLMAGVTPRRVRKED
jgi:hypothetical protein